MKGSNVHMDVYFWIIVALLGFAAAMLFITKQAGVLQTLM